MGADFKNVVKGFATAASPVMADLLIHDTVPGEPVLRETGNHFPAPRKVPFGVYYDPEFAKLEMEKVWKKSWQPAGRVEDLPEIGDRKLYEVGTLSFIIVRSGEHEFRALQNACLHRGTRLCSGPSISNSIKCPFHAWEWNLDGSLKNIPSRWDFPDVKNENYHLPEAKVGLWGGFIFINPDPNADPLEDYLGVLPKHFSRRDAEDRYTFVGFRKKLRANWKLAQEAFLEAYHVMETHPNIMSYNSDTGACYDIWDDGKAHISRSITASAVPSGHLGDDASRLQAAQDSLNTFAKGLVDEVPKIKSAETGRGEVAQWRRDMMSKVWDVDLSQVSDSGMLDANEYFMFPNFFPWWGEGLPLSYTFLPYEDDPNQCIAEFRLLFPIPEHGPRPPAAELIEIDFDTPIASVPPLGFIASVFDQDFSNAPLVQKGLRSTTNGEQLITLGRYQECRITGFYEVLDRWLAKK